MMMKKHEFCFYVKGQIVYIKPFRNAVKLMLTVFDISSIFMFWHMLSFKHRGLVKFVSSAYNIVLKLELDSWISFI